MILSIFPEASMEVSHIGEKKEQILRGKPDYSELSFGRMMETQF